MERERIEKEGWEETCVREAVLFLLDRRQSPREEGFPSVNEMKLCYKLMYD